MKLQFFSITAILAFSFIGQAQEQASLTALRQQYQTEYSIAANRGAYSGSAFRLAFSVDGVPARETVGNILKAFDLQELALEDYRNHADELPAKTVRPGNDLKTNAGLAFVELNIARECRHCTSMQERLKHAKAVHDLMEIYDIQAAGATSPRSKVKFSGLPFFDLAAEKFSDPLFQKRTLALAKRLGQILSQQSEDPNFDPKTNIYNLALQVCDGNNADALELAGLLLSRDSNIIKYFSFMPVQNLEFVAAAAKIPLMVRLTAALYEVATGNPADRFSFDGKYAVNDARNYYFWSGALVSQELRKRGTSETDISELNLQFARHYKILRWYEDQVMRLMDYARGKGLKPFDQASHDLHAFRTMRITGAGVRLAKPLQCRSVLIPFFNGILNE